MTPGDTMRAQTTKMIEELRTGPFDIRAYLELAQHFSTTGVLGKRFLDALEAVLEAGLQVDNSLSKNPFRAAALAINLQRAAIDSLLMIHTNVAEMERLHTMIKRYGDKARMVKQFRETKENT